MLVYSALKYASCASALIYCIFLASNYVNQSLFVIPFDKISMEQHKNCISELLSKINHYLNADNEQSMQITVFSSTLHKLVLLELKKHCRYLKECENAEITVVYNKIFGDHLTTCPWSNPKCTVGPDTCYCYKVMTRIKACNELLNDLDVMRLSDTGGKKTQQGDDGDEEESVISETQTTTKCVLCFCQYYITNNVQRMLNSMRNLFK